MKQKKLKIKDATLFVYRPKISLLADITDPTTSHCKYKHLKCHISAIKY